MRSTATPLAASLCSVLLCSGVVAAQSDTVAYFGFDGDLAPWTSVDLSARASGDVWTQATGPTSGRFPLPTPQTTSAANGYAVFDSDAQCSGSQNTRLVGPVLDLSATTEVEVRWQQVYRRFASAIFLEVSIDGGETFGSEELAVDLADGAYLGGANGAPDFASVPLSDVAAGQSEVVIAFRFESEPAVFGEDAGCGYAWIIDDVAVASSVAPAPAVDLAIGRVAPPQNFATPAARQGTLPLYAEVNNRGTEDQEVAVSVLVTPTGGEAIVFEATSESFTVPAGAVAAAPGLMEVPLPENPGSYTATYAITGAEQDLRNADNSATYDFEVTDSTYRKAPGVTSFVRPRGDASYSAGTVFDLGSEPARLDSISFAVQVDGNVATATSTLTVGTYGYLGDRNGDGALALGTELVELSSRGVPVGSLLLGGEDVVSVSPTQTGEPLLVDAEYERLAVLVTAPRTDSAAATRVSLGFYGPGRSYDFELLREVSGADSVQVISRVDGGGLRTGGFGGGMVPVVGLVVGAPEATSTRQQDELLQLALSPNPTSGYVDVRLPATVAQDATVNLFGIDGRSYLETPVMGVRTRLELGGVPAGLYTVVVTGSGRRATSRLIVGNP